MTQDERDVVDQERPVSMRWLTGIRLCSDFDMDCFEMTTSQHEMCAKSLPMYCSETGEFCGEFEQKDGHCPFEVQP